MEQYNTPQGSSKGLSIAALICGALGIISFFIYIFSTVGAASAESVAGVKAVTAIVIIGLILSICGIILGAIGMKKAKDYGESKGLAIAGLICGIVGTVFAFIGCMCACALCAGLAEYGL